MGFELTDPKIENYLYSLYLGKIAGVPRTAVLG